LFKEERDDFLSKVAERKVEIFAKIQAAEATFLREFDESPNIEKRVLGRLFCKVECHEALRYIKWADWAGVFLVVTFPRILLCHGDMKDLGKLKRWAKWRYVSFYFCLFCAMAALTGAAVWLSYFDGLDPDRELYIGILSAAIVVLVFLIGLDLHMCTVLSYAAIDLEQTLNDIAVYKKKNVEKY
jgi:hypothetical protein